MSADTSDGRIHTASMENLDPETIYHFRVISVDEHENTATSDDYNFTTKRTEDLVTSILYPSMTIGGRVHNLSFNLFNGSSQRITVTKVEILDGADSIVFTMGNSDIVETWGSGIVISGNSVSAGISFGIPPTTTDVQNWSVKWYCTYATGGDLIIFGSHTTF